MGSAEYRVGIALNCHSMTTFSYVDESPCRHLRSHLASAGVEEKEELVSSCK